MSQRVQGQESGPQGPRPVWNPRDGPQEQARSTGQRSNLPSQQRAANQSRPTQPKRQQAPKMQSQDQAPQWPLVDSNGPSAVTGSQRGPPPPRPPRPNVAPLVFNAPRPANNREPPAQAIPQYRQDSTSQPVTRYAQQEPGAWQEEEYGSPTYPAPNLSRPLTGSSFASTSSEYSVPDFPVPQIPQNIQQSQALPQNRRPPLGPPPSARRGPSSYYPQNRFVPPIVEETDSVYSQSTRANHDSYASSNAIPIGISEFYLEDRHAPLTDDESPFEGRYVEEDSDSDHAPEVVAVPVRQASVGKRSKPTLTTIKSNDSIRPDSQTRPLSIKTMNSLDSPKMATSVESVPMVQLSPVARPIRPSDPFRARTSSSGVLAKGSLTTDSSSESEKTLKQKRSRELLAVAREQVRTRSPLAQSETGAENDVSEKGFDFGIEDKPDDSEKKGSLAQRVGSRRPPRLNVDAVKDAEARGSLTSLPDLILRATRLASNLDRGRTASRLGMDWFGGDERRKSELSSEKRQSKNSLSDILASFPPPGLATPPGSRGSRGSRGMGQFPSHLRHSSLPSESDPGEDTQRKRRCCGMPLWLFLLLLLVILLVVAAAVVIPIVLIVIPNQTTSGGTSSKALASCQKSLSCENGGTNIIGTDGSCSCLCVNGFTGTRCGEESTTGCATTDVDGASNVTVGDAIPRLLDGSQTNFSVPLNGSTILGMFASNNLSCTSENALVTFNGLSARSLGKKLDSVAAVLTEVKTNPTPTLHKRQDATSSADAVATSNGIVFDSTPTSTSSASSASATATATNSTSSSSNSTMLDFARIAVLFVMQDSGQLESAVTAQENLQDYFTSGTTSVGQTIDSTNITLASGYTANLQEHTIVTSGGSTVGS